MPRSFASEADVRLNVRYCSLLWSDDFRRRLFGCAPALQAARLNLNETLKEGGRTGVSVGRHHVRPRSRFLPISLALTLLAAAGLAVP